MNKKKHTFWLKNSDFITIFSCLDKDTDILKWPLQCNTKFAYNVFHEVTGGPCILLNGLHFNSTHKLYTPFAFVSISLFHQAAGGDKNRWFYCPPTTYQKTYNIDKKGLFTCGKCYMAYSIL